MHPFARALSDFHSGNRNAAFIIRRDDGFQQQVPAAPFFDAEHYPRLERRALDECHGSVLDIGSAAGRHSLDLLRRGFKVTSLDVLPEMRLIMEDRGLTDVVIADIFQFGGQRHDTLLMLMNGIGMAGSMGALEQFLLQAHDLVCRGGQILCDSIDVSVTTHPQHVAYRENNVAAGHPAGQQAFIMGHEDEDSVRFNWLHIDFQSLSRVCDATGWEAELLESENDGHYLCKITQNPSHENKAGPPAG